MDHFQPAVDPRKQELLEARFLGARVSFILFAFQLKINCEKNIPELQGRLRMMENSKSAYSFNFRMLRRGCGNIFFSVYVYQHSFKKDIVLFKLMRYVDATLAI